MLLGFGGLKQRHLVPELMDDPALNEFEHIRALRGLERLNRISFADYFFWKAILKFYYSQG